MFKVLQKKKLAENTFMLQVKAGDIAGKAKPGQFIILRIDEKGERVPLTIADTTKSTVTLVVLKVGHTSERLSKLKKGYTILDFIGPLGNPSRIEKYGNVCLVAGGLGIAPMYPIAKALKEKGNRVIAVIGAKTKKHLFWEDKFEKISDKMVICTDDGSRGIKGFVTAAFEKSIKKDKLNKVFCIGPPVMMKAVSDISRRRVKTTVSLNPIMVDGIGMCGSCRVTVAGRTKFACVDGPEFDAHKVDFDSLIHRNTRYDKIKKHKGCH
ncbi:sulfide/dihydroorotate dehydrogenase-like FAD/NAD-binding protein [Candidatus Woesearchaeota archaeon]|nr:sulfide/dihydroorotate dehydrogenase-like FAD/NAD-binding protein [Candidatus Woesearchaeota archaeon]